MGGSEAGGEKRPVPFKKFNIFKKERGSHVGQNFLISLKYFDPQFDTSD